MAPGMELLFASAVSQLSRPQDPLICFIHWELISRGYRCLGEGAGAQDTGSEQLPVGWAENKELYTLRYRTRDSAAQILLKALTVEGTLILNIMDLQTEKVCDLTLNVEEYIDSDHLQQYDRVYKNTPELRRRLLSDLISPFTGPKRESRASERERERHPEPDPLRVPPRVPISQPPVWTDPLAHVPYGAADLDPLGPDPDHLPPPGYDDMFM